MSMEVSHKESSANDRQEGDALPLLKLSTPPFRNTAIW